MKILGTYGKKEKKMIVKINKKEYILSKNRFSQWIWKRRIKKSERCYGLTANIVISFEQNPGVKMINA